MSAFLERLREAGVEVAPRVATTGHVSGISYGLDSTTFRGSALGRAYSWRGLQERLGVDYSPERDLGAVRAAAGAGLDAQRRSSPWSPASLEVLQNELRALPIAARRGVLARATAELSRRRAGALNASADAARLAYALRSPRSAARHAVRRVPGLSALAPALDLASAARSPLGLLFYGARIATGAGRLALPALARPGASDGLSRGVTAAYVRAAATGAPTMSAFLDRLESAGVRPLPLVDKAGEVRAIAYRLGDEVIPGQALGPSFTWKGIQQRLGVSYEPTRDLPRIRAVRERPSPEHGAGAEPHRVGGLGGHPDRARGDESQARSARTGEPSASASERRAITGREPGAAGDGRGVGAGSGPADAGRDHAGSTRLGAEVAPARGAASRGAALPPPAADGGARASRGAEVALGGSATDERLAAAALRESLRRTGTPELATYHRHRAYAASLERADTAWATAALRRGVEPHVVLREVAEHGAKAATSKEAALAHGTRVVARALATVQPGRAVEKTVSLIIQALATAVKAPIAVVKALLIVRTIARELARTAADEALAHAGPALRRGSLHARLRGAAARRAANQHHEKHAARALPLRRGNGDKRGLGVGLPAGGNRPVRGRAGLSRRRHLRGRHRTGAQSRGGSCRRCRPSDRRWSCRQRRAARAQPPARTRSRRPPARRLFSRRAIARFGRALAHSPFEDRSWDSRYFGPIPTGCVADVVAPLVTIR